MDSQRISQLTIADIDRENALSSWADTDEAKAEKQARKKSKSKASTQLTAGE